jgi:hypothetical protein
MLSPCDWRPVAFAAAEPFRVRFTLIRHRLRIPDVDRVLHGAHVDRCEIAASCCQDGGDVGSASSADQEIGRFQTEAVALDLRLIGDPERQLFPDRSRFAP